MKRDYHLAKAYDSQVAHLHPWQAMLFAAGVVEHVVPLLARYGLGSDANSTVEELVAGALGETSDRARVGRLKQQLSSRVPHAQDDATLHGEFLRNGGVMLLEALDYLPKGDPRCLGSSAGGVFGLLTVAVDLFLKRDPGVWEELGEFGHADPVLGEEWTLHQVMLKELGVWADMRQLLAWRDRRRCRSQELSCYFRLAG